MIFYNNEKSHGHSTMGILEVKLVVVPLVFQLYILKNSF